MFSGNGHQILYTLRHESAMIRTDLVSSYECEILYGNCMTWYFCELVLFLREVYNYVVA